MKFDRDTYKLYNNNEKSFVECEWSIQNALSSNKYMYGYKEIHCYSWRCSDKKTHFHWVMVQEHQLLTLGFAFGKTNILIINHIACFCIFILYEWHVLKINKNGFRKCMFLLLVSIYICGIYSGCHASKHSLMAISIVKGIR